MPKELYKVRSLVHSSQYVCVINWTHFHYSYFCSGGLVVVARKHKEPLKFCYNSGFYITTNEYPDFGPGVDSVAIRKRLSVFNTKALPRKDNNATGKCTYHRPPYYHMIFCVVPCCCLREFFYLILMWYVFIHR